MGTSSQIALWRLLLLIQQLVLGRIRYIGACSNQGYAYYQTHTSPCQVMFMYLLLSFPVLVRCNVHHHHLLFLFLLPLFFFLLLLFLLFRSSTLEDSIKQYEQDLARKLYQSRQWAPAPGARPAQMSSPVQSHASRIPGSGSQSRCAQPQPCWLHAQLSCLCPHILMQCTNL